MTKIGVEELLKAIETVQTLKETVGKLDDSIATIEARLDRLEALMREMMQIVDALNR